MRANLMLIAAVMTAGWAATTFAAEPRDADYYPLKVGNEWRYEFESDGKTSTLVSRVAKQEEIDGVLLYRIDSEIAGEPFGTEHLRMTDEGVFRCRYNGGELVPPVCVIKFPIKDGETWEGKTGRSKEKYDVTGSLTMDEVEVPFGKFAAAKVCIATSENGMPITSTYWFAPGVGYVKQVMRFGKREMAFELVDFKAGE